MQVVDYFWSARLQTLSMLAADATKYDKRALSPEDIKALEAAKHYIEIALRNDQLSKSENAA